MCLLLVVVFVQNEIGVVIEELANMIKRRSDIVSTLVKMSSYDFYCLPQVRLLISSRVIIIFYLV